MSAIEVERGGAAPGNKPHVTVRARDDGRFEFFGFSGSLDIQLDPRIFETEDHARQAAISWGTAHNSGDFYLVMPNA